MKKMVKLDCQFNIIPAIGDGMKPTEFKLFWKMWTLWNYYRDEEDWYYISLKKLSLTSGISINTILPIIERWVENGMIFKKCTTRIKGSSNYYKFNIQRIQELVSDISKNCNYKNCIPNNIEKEEINKNYIGYSKDINDCSCIVTEDKEKIKNKKESCDGDSLQSGTTENNTIKVFNNSSSGVVDRSSVDKRGFDNFQEFYGILDDGDEDSPLAETPEEVKKLYEELTPSGKVDSPTADENNTKTDFSNIPSGDGESAQSSTVGNDGTMSPDEWDSAVFGTPPVEEDLHISIGISNNGAGRTLTPQVEEVTTPHKKTQENAPQTAKIASFEKMTPQTVENEHQNIKNNAPEKPQNEQKDSAAANGTLKEKIHKLRENMEMGKDLLYEACKMKSLSLWRERAEWTKLQLKNLKKLDMVAWEKERSSFKSWSDKTKHCFPEGWDKKEEPQPKEYETEIRPVDIQIFKYWKEKGDSDAVNTLIGRFLDKYGPVTVDKFLSNWSGAVSVEDKKKVEKVVEKTPLQTWAETWFKLQNRIESANVDSEEYDKLLDEGIELFKVFPKDEGDWSRQQDTIKYFISYQAEHGRPTDKIYNKWIVNNTDDEKKKVNQD